MILIGNRHQAVSSIRFRTKASQLRGYDRAMEKEIPNNVGEPQEIRDALEVTKDLRFTTRAELVTLWAKGG